MPRSRFPLIVGAVGVVFGDIGTSTLYAMSAVLRSGDAHPKAPAPAVLYGMTSTIIWSMVLIVTVLYVRLLLRADNDGEGGLLALVGLIRQRITDHREVALLTLVGMFGAAMFLGDSVITPAISVLSAAEGLEIINASFKTAVVPFTVVVLAGLFVIQRFGTGRIGSLFGPVMLTWFAVIAILGVVGISREPAVLQALSPQWIFTYVRDEPKLAFLSLGSVVLAVTGAEALYADLGHFGRPAITRAWLFVVMPSLILSYLGQAAAVLHSASAVSEPFFALVPSWARIPMVALATLATIIASQAVISGAFTVIHQAGRLGLLPPLRTVHTSLKRIGQIYIPAVNWMLAAAVLAVVFAFRSSTSLTGAYGVAVTLTISVSTIMYLLLRRHDDGRITPGFVAGAAILLIVLIFVAANVPKIRTGGWLPLSIGLILLLVMSTWSNGQRRVVAALHEHEATMDHLIETIARGPDGNPPTYRVPGSAIFLTRDSNLAPLALCTMVEQNHVLAGEAILLSWSTADNPVVPDEQKVTFHAVDGLTGFFEVTARFGYHEKPLLNDALQRAADLSDGEFQWTEPDSAMYFVSLPVVTFSRQSSMWRWRQRLYIGIRRLTPDAVELQALPRERTIVISREIRL